MAETDVMTAGKHVDKITANIIDLLNALNANKSPLLVAGSNITITQNQDGTITISATGGGGGGGGVSILDDLNDVTITNPANSEILKYDGTKWVNASNTAVASHDYSTSERVVGTWVDGKPIYEKTIKKNNIAIASGDTITHGISNFKAIISMEVAFHDSNSGMSTTENGLTWGPNGANGIAFRCNTTEIVVTGNNSWGAQTYRDWYFTLRYTKTTD